MGSDTSSLALEKSETAEADVDWTLQEQDLLNSLDLNALSLSPEASDDPKGFFKAAIPSLDETAMMGTVVLPETDASGGAKGATDTRKKKSDTLKRPVAIRSEMPRLGRSNSDPNIASLTEAQIDGLCADLEAHNIILTKSGTEAPVTIIPKKKEDLASALYLSLSAIDMAEEDESRSGLKDALVSSMADTSTVEPLKEKLMRTFSTSMKFNCIGVLFGDTAQTTVPVLESLSPRSVMYSVASMSESVTMAEMDDRYALSDEIEQRTRRPKWTGVFVVGNYKYEDTSGGDGGPITIMPTMHALRTQGFGIDDGESSDVEQMPALAALSTALVSGSTKVAAPLKPCSSGEIPRMVSIGVPKELVKSSLTKGATKRQKKKIKKVIKKSPVVTRLLRTFCYDSYDSDVVFFGETMSFEILPCFYRDRGKHASSPKSASEIKLAELESQIHPQILFECFDHGQLTLTSKRKRKMQKKKKQKSKSSKSSKKKKKLKKKDSAMDEKDEEEEDIEDDEADGEEEEEFTPSGLRADFISIKPGCMLVYIMQDLSVVRQASESAASAVDGPVSSSSAGPGLSRVRSKKHPASSTMVAGPTDDDIDFEFGTQRSASMRARTRTDASAMYELAAKKKARKKAVKKGTVGMETRKIAVGFVRISNLLDRVTLSADSTESSAALFQIPLYPVLGREMIRMVSLLMTEYGIQNYNDLLESPHLGRTHFGRFEVIRPPSIGSLISSVQFDWAG